MEIFGLEAVANVASFHLIESSISFHGLVILCVDDFGRIIDAVAGLEGFAGEVAKTVAKTIGGPSVARCSSKQAWIIACAIVENNMHFDRLS